jgi:hypothetical protein
MAVDLNARAQHLPAFFDHFLSLQGVVNDVAIFERQIVFAEHGADTLAPAAGWFQISDNFRFIHKSDSLLTLPQFGAKFKAEREESVEVVPDRICSSVAGGSGRVAAT